MEVISCYQDNISSSSFGAGTVRSGHAKVGVAKYPYRNREALRNFMAESWERKIHVSDDEKKARPKYKSVPVVIVSFIYLLIFVSVPLAVLRYAPVLENMVAPWVINAKLPPILDSEFSFLDKAMNRFALDDGYDIDFDGNVVLEDGTVLHAEDFVSEPVTFRNYTVKSGDTIGSITYGNGLRNTSTLIAVNKIDNVRFVREGQTLRIPSKDGIIHYVADGESLNSLSVKYHVSVEELLDVNDLKNDALSLNQELFIPGAVLDSDTLRKAMGELFIYPLSSSWRLTSPFGKRNDPFTGAVSCHYGIDMAAPTGTPIKAAMSGKVVFSGFSGLYGNYIIIDHLNGYQTLYGHMSKALAKTGQRVAQGEKIGLVGSTGQATGAHLHFTMYKKGKRIDPLPILKGTQKI